MEREDLAMLLSLALAAAMVIIFFKTRATWPLWVMAFLPLFQRLSENLLNKIRRKEEP